MTGNGDSYARIWQIGLLKIKKEYSHRRYIIENTAFMFR
jgi:hypothetical protein